VFHTGKRLTSAESEEALRRIRDERQRQNSHEGE
jgi:hypothetical protein